MPSANIGKQLRRVITIDQATGPLAAKTRRTVRSIVLHYWSCERRRKARDLRIAWDACQAGRR